MNDFLDELRDACRARQQEWETAQATRFSLAFYGLEFVSEAGELGNEIKKIEREAIGGGGSTTTEAKIGSEVADVLITLANALNKLEEFGILIDIDAVTRAKFNARSLERGFQTYLLDPEKNPLQG